jgi:recombination DNA repair RAD52 pathway protein
MIDKAKTDKLNAKLNSSEVQTRKGPGGADLSYVSGIYVINKMNEIFGPGGWAYDATVTRELLEGTDGSWRAVYSSRCVLTIEGAIAPIVDYGAGSKKGKEPGETIEHAIKEAVTDSLKRCCKSLGHVMGGALYEPTGINVMDDSRNAEIDAAVMEVIGDLAAAKSPADIAAARKRYTDTVGRNGSAEHVEAVKAAAQKATARIGTKEQAA